MIKAGILSLKDRNGSSRQALKKYIHANYNITAANFDSLFNVALRRGVASEVFIQPKGSSGPVKLNKAAIAAKKPAAKKPAAKKATAKKPAAKKATTTKKSTTAAAAPKKAPAKKTATAKKPAAKKASTTGKVTKTTTTKKAPAKKAATAKPKAKATKATK